MKQEILSYLLSSSPPPTQIFRLLRDLWQRPSSGNPVSDQILYLHFLWCINNDDEWMDKWNICNIIWQLLSNNFWVYIRVSLISIYSGPVFHVVQKRTYFIRNWSFSLFSPVAKWQTDIWLWGGTDNHQYFGTSGFFLDEHTMAITHY